MSPAAVLVIRVHSLLREYFQHGSFTVGIVDKNLSPTDRRLRRVRSCPPTNKMSAAVTIKHGHRDSIVRSVRD